MTGSTGGQRLRVAQLDLDRPRELPELLATAVRLWLAHLPLFFTLALVVAAPIALLVEGLWGGTLGDPDATTGVANAIVWWLCAALVTPSLVTAMHVVAVQDLGEGRRPTIRRSAAVAVRLFPQVLLVVAGYVFVSTMGFLLCIAPGLFIAVRWYFGAQAAVATGRRGGAAWDLSEQLVAGRWWSTLGALVAFFIAGAIPSWLAGWGIDQLGSQPARAAGNILLSAGAVSFSAVAGTLLFFSLLAKSSGDHS